MTNSDILVQRVVQNHRLPTGEIDGELLALDSEGGEVLGLDEIGTALWKLAREPIVVGDLVEWTLANYDVERGQAEQDIARFVSELLEAKMLRCA